MIFRMMGDENHMVLGFREAVRSGWEDLAAALRQWHLTATLGWQDVATRYRRSRVGALWLTINMGVLIVALSLVFGTLFQMDAAEFIPYLAIGLVFWGFISGVIGEGCTSFSAASESILQVRMPLATHVGLVVYRNVVVLGHNLLILPLVFVFFWRPVGLDALLALPGLVLVVINLLWMVLILAVVCARYRDVTQIVQNIMQVLFYLTPIIWSVDLLRERAGDALIQWLLWFNPIYHLITVVRAPLLGEPVSAFTWSVVLGMAFLGWSLALPFFGHYRKRVPYWL
jgi:ABC-type polysaccharide/polyol phosphate export permease